MTVSIRHQRVEPMLGVPPMQSLSDEEIVRRVLAGETSLFETIMRRYNPRLFRTLRVTVKNDGEAEDIMQEAYVRAYQSLAQFEGRSRFSTWLMRIAIHEALARRRQAIRLAELDERNEPRTTTTPEDSASASELRAILEGAIQQLPEGLRLVFMLRDVDGLATEETANCLGITHVNVRVRLHRARTFLRTRLDRPWGTDARQLHPFAGERCDRVVSHVLSRILGQREKVEA